jgi:hypothetical protein
LFRARSNAVFYHTRQHGGISLEILFRSSGVHESQRTFYDDSMPVAAVALDMTEDHRRAEPDGDGGGCNRRFRRESHKIHKYALNIRVLIYKQSQNASFPENADHFTDRSGPPAEHGPDPHTSAKRNDQVIDTFRLYRSGYHTERETACYGMRQQLPIADMTGDEYGALSRGERRPELLFSLKFDDPFEPPRGHKHDFDKGLAEMDEAPSGSTAHPRPSLPAEDQGKMGQRSFPFTGQQVIAGKTERAAGSNTEAIRQHTGNQPYDSDRTNQKYAIDKPSRAQHTFVHA